MLRALCVAALLLRQSRHLFWMTRTTCIHPESLVLRRRLSSHRRQSSRRNIRVFDRFNLDPGPGGAVSARRGRCRIAAAQSEGTVCRAMATAVVARLRALARELVGVPRPCSNSALSTQIEEFAEAVERLRLDLDASEAARRTADAARQASEAERAREVKTLVDRVGRRDADIKVLHAKLKEARSQAVRLQAVAQRLRCLRATHAHAPSHASVGAGGAAGGEGQRAAGRGHGPSPDRRRRGAAPGGAGRSARADADRQRHVPPSAGDAVGRRASRVRGWEWRESAAHSQRPRTHHTLLQTRSRS